MFLLAPKPGVIGVGKHVVIMPELFLTGLWATLKENKFLTPRQNEVSQNSLVVLWSSFPLSPNVTLVTL